MSSRKSPPDCHRPYLRNVILAAIAVVVSISFAFNAPRKAFGRGPQPQPDITFAASPEQTTLTWAAESLDLDVDTLIENDGWSNPVIGDAKLPMRLITFESKQPQIHIEALTLTPASPPPATAAEQANSSPTSSTSTTPPSSPLFVLRQAVARGTPMTIIAFSPFVFVDGAWSRVTALRATVSGAVAQQGATTARSILRDADSALGTLEVDSVAGTAVSPPTNPVQTGANMWRIVVAQPGIQRLMGSVLVAAGINLSTVTANRLRVQHDGADLAVQIIDAEGNGKLDAADELRFFARVPGDRWNQTDTYWLSVATVVVAQMATRDASNENNTNSANGADAAPTRTTAAVEGDWHRKSLYDSLTPGPDLDHWFAARLDSTTRSVDAVLNSSLPFSAGTMIVTATGSLRQADAVSGITPASAQALHITLSTDGAQQEAQAALAALIETHTTRATKANTASSDWTSQFAVTTSANAMSQAVQISASGGSTDLNDIRWKAPATLTFNKKGAFFTGVDGTWTYRLSDVPAGAMLYDVTDWLHPVLLPMQATSGAMQFTDGPNAKHYLLAGADTQFEPPVSMRATADLAKPINGRGLYIAPAGLHAALQPLLAHRTATGWLVKLIDTQAIYDSWSYGQVSPDAIRNFLRYAMSAWSIKPNAVVLVGDGNYDPLNHTGSAPPTLVPPYLADVDPWLGEAACESCYAQLDGNDPLSDALPDIYFGRLPAKNAAEVTVIVNKIIGYETAAPGTWMWRNVFTSDNFREADGTMDEAGNFAAFNDGGVAMQPFGVDAQRAYFDPYASTANQPGHISDAAKAHERLLSLWNAGAAVVNYSGHGQTDHWAYLGGSALNFLTAADAASLSNGARLPFVLSMACLTGSFHLPSSASGGNSVDEQLVLAPNGGAIGTWSSTGMGVMYSHEFLRNGFYHALWSGTPGSLTLGALTRASLIDLFEHAACCQEPLRTYALLGDPMTPLRVALPSRHVFVPTMAR